MLQGFCFVTGRPEHETLWFFRVKWLQPAMKGTSSVRRVRLRSVCRFFLPQCNGGFKLLWVCLCVRSYRVFWNLCLQIALGVAASRLLAAAAACVILLSFAAEDCKSYWSGCIQAAIVICQQIFPILALTIFLLKFFLKSASKSSFFRFGVEIRFWSCNFRRHCT